ncbi:MAG: hypothetical protein LWX56_05745 [Ignavibacteria bacterium]|nr:hypothetical protein [Ignavibacteria bacterium]
MSEKTVINGWSIVHGDYLRDPEYDDQFIKNKQNKVKQEHAVFAIGSLLALVMFITVMGWVALK